MIRISTRTTAALIGCLALAPLSAQQGLTFSLVGSKATGLTRDKQPSSIVFELVGGPPPIVLHPRLGQDVATLVDELLAGLKRLGYGTTRLGVNEGWVHPEDWRKPLFESGMLLASNDTGVSIGAGFRAAVIPSSSTKSNGIAIPPARKDAVAPSNLRAEITVHLVSSNGTPFSQRVPVSIAANSDRSKIDQATSRALATAGFLLNDIGVRSLLQASTNLLSFGIDRTSTDDQVVGVTLSSEFASSGLFDLETAAAWLPTAGFTEFGRASPGNLAATPRIYGSGAPRIGLTHTVTCEFGLASAPAWFVVGANRGELNLLGADIIVALGSEVVLQFQTDASGRIVQTLPIPDRVEFAGVKLFQQGVIATGQSLAATPGLYTAIGR
ncbi:MAG: hypothetical protein KDC87_17060 [Planctomycetes bacterium]|nr:hypothetical protein [Planctomycetota bacterium]MCB9872178.1 hypothetical protein [Planctomycetota bacterium]